MAAPTFAVVSLIATGAIAGSAANAVMVAWADIVVVFPPELVARAMPPPRCNRGCLKVVEKGPRADEAIGRHWLKRGFIATGRVA